MARRATARDGATRAATVQAGTVQAATVRADERRATPQPVGCARCAATVEVVKFSPRHTSVQWTAAAAGRCAELRARAAQGTPGALVGGCAALRASIDAAVAAGLLAIAPPGYDTPGAVQGDPVAR